MNRDVLTCNPAIYVPRNTYRRTYLLRQHSQKDNGGPIERHVLRQLENTASHLDAIGVLSAYKRGEIVRGCGRLKGGAPAE
jgi:hypothetical protein